jgi:hypothetical protein
MKNIIKAFKNEYYLLIDSSLKNKKCSILVRKVNVITKELK